MFGLLVLGFAVTLILAWYHGERGAQRISGPELLLIALALAIGGGLIWHFARAPTAGTASARAVAGTGSPQTARRSPESPASATEAKATTAMPSATSIASEAPAIAAIPIPAKSVAVLPFENLSTDKGNAYFADGMQDLILTKLADIGDLKVISRTSTMQYGAHPQNLTLVGQQLGVATILEGSVQKAGNQVLINVQLIDARTDSHIWAQSYTRTLDNIFGVEGEVAEKVAKALNAKLTPRETRAVAKVLTHNKQAYDAYLKGIYYLYDGQDNDRPSEFELSVGFLQQAVDHDPKFAGAFSALAAAYRHMGGHHDQAESAIRRALALNPNSTFAHIQLARLLDEAGQFDEAFTQAHIALRQDPKNPGLVNGLGNIYSDAGRYDDAIAAYKHAIELSSSSGMTAVAQLNMAQALAAQRRYAAARDAANAVVARNPSAVGAATTLTSIYEVGWGDLASARNVLEAMPVPVTSSGALSDAWYWLDLYGRDYAAALNVMAKAPAAWFKNNDSPLGLYQGQVYQAQGDAPRAKAAFATARTQLESWIKDSPHDVQLHATLASVLANLGERDAAIIEAHRAMALRPIDRYPYEGVSPLVNMAAVQARIGNAAAAVKLLDRLMSIPAGLSLSGALLRIDPAWDPIRHDPAFQALLEKYGKPEPTSSTSAGVVPNS
ncbi:MAG: tetratricopeptide repeat protein [Proteobacteria bacterium]|nr:tetratricopeptide repeat protein [Pseudomonadota bacterium]